VNAFEPPAHATDPPFEYSNLIGTSAVMHQLYEQIGQVARTNATPLVRGESGTGKELVAHAIHHNSPRGAMPFVKVNCAALPEPLFESELFGHERGAFTGAHSRKKGRFELARGGTLFLDEVDALTPKAQVTLLRFLQDQQFRPLGGRRDEQADVRVIAASNRSLERQVEAEAFRLDLLYRLKLLNLALPPLRERHGDIALLAQHFVAKAAARYGKRELPIEPATLAWFERYSWPGNIRELENLVSRAFLLAEGDVISEPAPALLHRVERAEPAPLNYRQAKIRAVAEFESVFLSRLFDQANGNVSAAARLSGTERRHLGRLLKKYGITRV
jgi:transcriptional regulator with GAF, ATPase, and Fis domain